MHGRARPNIVDYLSGDEMDRRPITYIMTLRCSGHVLHHPYHLSDDIADETPTV